MRVCVFMRACVCTCIGLGASSSNCCHCTQTEVRAGWKALDSCDCTLRCHFDLVLGSKYSPHPPPFLAMALRRWWLGADLVEWREGGGGGGGGEGGSGGEGRGGKGVSVVICA